MRETLRSYATKVYYIVAVGGVDASAVSNVRVPPAAVVGRYLLSIGVPACRCRAKRNWRILVHGSQAAVSANLVTIQQSVRQAWASSLQFVRKLLSF